MGENNMAPEEKPQNETSSDKEEDYEEEMEEDDDLDDMSPEEFQAINNQLDALNSALDDIEEKNDNIHARLVKLLESNKEIRQSMQAQPISTDEPMEPAQ